MPCEQALFGQGLFELPGRIQHHLDDALDLAVSGNESANVQAESPGADKESNWLPANAGPFTLQLRMYLPKPEALEGPYGPPPVIKA